MLSSSVKKPTEKKVVPPYQLKTFYLKVLQSASNIGQFMISQKRTYGY